MKKSVKAIIFIAIALICICTTVLTVKHSDKKDPSVADASGGSPQNTDVSAQSGNGIRNDAEYPFVNSGFAFSDIISYSGGYIEDGSNEPVKNTASIKIKNMSGTDCRYAEIKATTEDGDFEFVLTTLKDGDSVAVLEKNKKSCKEKCGIKSIAIEKFAAFDEKPQLCEDIFELTVNNRVINIKNISDKDIDGTIYVYYKNQKDNILFGGITYRIPFDSLKAGELKQASSKHLSKENSVLEFVTYEH